MAHLPLINNETQNSFSILYNKPRRELIGFIKKLSFKSREDLHLCIKHLGYTTKMCSLYYSDILVVFVMLHKHESRKGHN